MLKKLISLFLLATTLSVITPIATAQPAARPEVAEKVKAWHGTEGIKVWTLRYGPLSDKKALVQITDVDHPWNKKIQLMDVESKGERRKYSIMLEGKKYVVLVMERYSFGEVYLPGESTTYAISYSEELSSRGDAQHFLTDWLNQEEAREQAQPQAQTEAQAQP